MERAPKASFAERTSLSHVFESLPNSVARALNIVRPQVSQLQVPELDEDEYTVMRPASHSALTSLYRIRSLLFFVAIWTEPKLSMKRRLSTNQVRRYVQKVLKKTETRNSELEEEDGTSIEGGRRPG